MKSATDLAKLLELARNLYLTLRKCCACHKICTRPCESVAPATKSAPDLAKVLRLPRILHALPCAPAPVGFATRPCQRCGNGACHEIKSSARQKPCETSTLLLQWAPVRDRPDTVRGRGTFRASSAATSCALPRFRAFSIFSRTRTRCWNTAPATKSALSNIYFKSLSNILQVSF